MLSFRYNWLLKSWALSDFNFLVFHISQTDCKIVIMSVFRIPFPYLSFISSENTCSFLLYSSCLDVLHNERLMNTMYDIF